jgi:uncharacterized iron-regulated membrane protein
MTEPLVWDGQIGWGGSVMAFLTLAVIVVGFAAGAWMYVTRYDAEKDARQRRLQTPRGGKGQVLHSDGGSFTRRGVANELSNDEL